MPKFKKVLAMTPKVKTLVYMEDQLKELDKTGYGEDISIISFTDVLKKGKVSEYGKPINRRGVCVQVSDNF